MRSRGNGINVFPKQSNYETTSVHGSTNDGSTNLFAGYDVDGTLAAYIDTQGFQRVNYRDEFPGGTWETPQGSTAPDVTTHTIGGVPFRIRSFDGGSTTETISNNFEIPHDMDCEAVNSGDLSVEWHVHCLPATDDAGVIKFFLNYCYVPYVPGGDNSAIAQDPLTVLVTIAETTQYDHYIVGTSMPIPLGGFQIGGMILFNLVRVPSDGSDTYTRDALLLQTALHVPVNSLGSRQRYTK